MLFSTLFKAQQLKDKNTSKIDYTDFNLIFMTEILKVTRDKSDVLVKDIIVCLLFITITPLTLMSIFPDIVEEFVTDDSSINYEKCIRYIKRINIYEHGINQHSLKDTNMFIIDCIHSYSYRSNLSMCDCIKSEFLIEDKNEFLKKCGTAILIALKFFNILFKRLLNEYITEELYIQLKEDPDENYKIEIKILIIKLWEFKQKAIERKKLLNETKIYNLSICESPKTSSNYSFDLSCESPKSTFNDCNESTLINCETPNSQVSIESNKIEDLKIKRELYFPFVILSLNLTLLLIITKMKLSPD